jgi:energy-coupling factor transporter ATP-binding protein EcfA2
VRLRGFAFEDAAGPVTRGFVPLGELTAVIGANDSGKSRLLQTMYRALGSACELGPTECLLVVELEEEEIRRLFAAVGDRDFPGLCRRTEGQRESDKDLVASVWEAIRAVGDGLGPSWPAVHRALWDSRVFAFSRHVTDGKRTSLHWCLPAKAELAPDVLQAVEELEVSSRRGASGQDAVESEPAVPEAADEGSSVRVRLGDVSVAHIPGPVCLPTTDDELSLLVSATVGRLLSHLGWHDGAEPLLDSFVSEPLTLGDIRNLGKRTTEAKWPAYSPPQMPTVDWLERPTVDTVRLKADVTRACEFVEAVATRLAPDFIRDRYSLAVSVTPDSIISNTTPIQFGLSLRGLTNGQDLGPTFATEELADGYRIWIQLALLQAVDSVRQLTDELAEGADAAFQAASNLEDAAQRPDTKSCGLDLRFLASMDEVPRFRKPGSARTEFLHFGSAEELIQAMTLIISTYLEHVRGFRAGIRAGSDAPVRIRVPAEGGDVLRPPFFLIDEPERHLHPAAQRQLAGWLRDLVRVHDTQALVITHAVPFLQQADAISYVSRDQRNSSSATVRPCTGAELTALGEIAGDLGLNRGELLTGTSVLLFVEGQSDQYVLEALFGERLRSIGVVVIPLGGATQAVQVVDAQVLVRFSTAKAAVLLDNLEHREIDLLLTDPEYRASAARGKTEEQAVAKLLNEAFARGRVPEVHGIPVEDIFFLLDPQAIRDTFRELRRTDDTTLATTTPVLHEYPDHETARSEYSRTHDTWTGTRWKKFLLKRYGIPFEDVSWYARVADRMRHAGQLPQPLVDVVDCLELSSRDLTDNVG